MNIGLKKIKTNSSSFKFYKNEFKQHLFQVSIDVNVKMHQFLRKNEYEFDVFICDSFLESPGKWLK